MSAIDHWNAVLTSGELRSKPVGVSIDGRELVLFRSPDGAVGALDDSCPHRRMRLSAGCVVGGKLQCPYHGWTFDCNGDGESPGTPKMRAHARHYDVREAYGVIWVKPVHSDAEFPTFEVDGHYHVCSFTALAPAPLETTLDNFTEIEHTATTHIMFGYILERMAEVTTQVEANDRFVRVVNSGPHKPISQPLRAMMGLSGPATFVDEWLTYFSPLHVRIDHSWTDAATGRPAKVRLRVYVFLTPRSDEETLVTTVAFTKSTWPGPYGGVRLVKPILSYVMRREIALDCRMLGQLADKRPQLQGMKLSRFDRPMGLHRERINRIYLGQPDATQRSGNCVPAPQAEWAEGVFSSQDARS